MRITDLPQVLEIENNAQVMSWNQQSFEESLSNNHYCRVIEKDTENKNLLAFHVICSIIDELHILTLAVSTDHHGNGLAHALMHDIVEYAKSKEAEKIFLEVRESNLIAQNLYQKWQFKQIAIRAAYYRTPSNKREDALIYLRIV